MWFQIQEMIQSERIVDAEKIADEVAGAEVALVAEDPA